MAQIIALRRGEVTIANYGTTLLFTGPSTGSATRLMVGYLSWTSNNSPVYGYCTFSVKRSGSSYYVPFGATYNGSQARTQSLTPHDTRTGWNGNSSSNISQTPVLINLNSAGLIGAQGMTSSGGISRAWYNSDVMIGPSDEVYCSWVDNGGSGFSAVVQYCIVTVNE